MEKPQVNRASNFSKREIDILLDSLEACPQLITGEIGGKIPTKHHQRLAWEAVAQKVSEEGVERTGEQVKAKWCDLKYRSRLKVKKILHIKGTNNIPTSNFTDVEIRVFSIMGVIPASTEGLSQTANFIDAKEALRMRSSDASYEPPDHGSLRSILQEQESENEYSEDEGARSDAKETVMIIPSNSTQVKTPEFILPNVSSKKQSTTYTPSSSTERVALFRLRKRKWEDDEITEERIVATQERMATDIYKIRCSVNEMKNNMNMYMKKMDQKFDRMLDLLSVALNVDPQDFKS